MAEKKNILTYEGLRALEEELQDLKVNRRKQVAVKIKEAREQGDLSENAEYDAAKDEQRDIELRIEEIDKILKNAEVVDEEDKNEIVKRVLEELKSKKLLKNPKSSYKSTEKILYSLNVLPEAIALIDEEVEKLEKEAEDIPKAPAKSNSLILNEKNNTYIYGDETLETRISELKQISVKAKSQVRLVKSALKKIEEDKWYDIIPMYYFDNMKIEAIAEELDCSVSTISDNKKRLMNELKVYIFPDTFIEEL